MDQTITTEQKIELLKIAATLGINAAQDRFNTSDDTILNFEKLLAAINN